MRLRALILVVSLAVASACGDDGGGGDDGDTAPDDGASALRVGRFDFPESALLAELYRQALESVGVPARTVDAAGAREGLAPALEQGHLDLLPEYLGSALSQYGTDEIDPEPTVDTLRGLLDPRGLTALTPAPAENVNVFVVLAERELGPTLSDLADVAPDLRFGGTPECVDRPLCLVGLADTYGIRFGEVVIQRSLELRAEALRRDEIDVALLFSTSAELSDEFRVLDDDRGLQPPENVVPVIRVAALERWGDAAVRGVLDEISAVLTTTELRRLNQAVRRGDPVGQVVAEWLARQGITDDT